MEIELGVESELGNSDIKSESEMTQKTEKIEGRAGVGRGGDSCEGQSQPPLYQRSR